MRKRLLLMAVTLPLVFLHVQTAKADVVINEENFPDANFRAWLLDEFNSAVLTEEDIQSITEIFIDDDLNIRSLEGIKVFTALKKLVCVLNQLTSLDLSGCTALKQLCCSANKLTELNLSSCTELEVLECNLNQLPHLDLSSCTKLKELECANNQLTTLDVSKCVELTSIACCYNHLRDAGMDTFIKSLPQTQGEGTLYVYSEDDLFEIDYSEPDGNVCLRKHVDAARAKNWNVFFYTNEKGWESYKGADGGISDIVINEQSFPDPNFRGWLLKQDYGEDGVLTEEEIPNITSIEVPAMGISTLKGIEVFTALKDLNCQKNLLTELDLSKCRVLDTVLCDSNQIASLDVSGCTELFELSCHENQLTSLDVINCSKLVTLFCDNNQLTALDLSNSKQLERFSCSYNRLTALDLTFCTKLGGFLWCTDNQLTSLKVSSPYIRYFYCNNNQLTTLDVSSCTELVSLTCDNNQLTSLNISGCTNLQRLYCYFNQLRGEGMDNLIASLPQTTNADIYVFCEDLTIDESRTEPDGNICTKEHVATAKAKGWTTWYFTNIEDETVWTRYSGADSKDIEINETTFPDANFRAWRLEQDYGQDGVLTENEINGITEISVNSRGISSLQGIEFFTALQDLHCPYNQLTTLDVSANTALQYLACFDNQLTTLNVSANIELYYLGCDVNQLTTLDVSGCTALQRLDCCNNQLTSLNVSGCMALQGLNCYWNQLQGEGMDAFINSLPNQEKAELCVYFEDTRIPDGNVCTKEQVAAAKAKGWTVYYYTDGEWKEYEGAEVGIDFIRASEKDGPWYDLSGRKLEGRPKSKGIYIINGKKTLVK